MFVACSTLCFSKEPLESHRFVIAAFVTGPFVALGLLSPRDTVRATIGTSLESLGEYAAAEKQIAATRETAMSNVRGIAADAGIEGFQDRGHFVIRETGYDRRNHHADRNARLAQMRDGVQSRARGRSARFEDALEFGIDRSDGNIDRRGVMRRQLN